MEIWKQIDYFPNFEVSTLGRVRNIRTGNILKAHNAGKGYMVVHISKDGKLHCPKIHKLVAEAFIDNPENKTQIDHINCDRTDNRVENLRWVTAKENCNNPKTKNRMSERMKGNTYNVGRVQTEEWKAKKLETFYKTISKRKENLLCS